jgi:zinc protease
MMTAAYTTHPYRLPIIGSEESVSSFTRDDILNYIAKHYHPENMAVVVVGDVRYQEVMQKVREFMGNMEQGTNDLAELPGEPEQQSSRFFMLKEDIGQGHMVMAIPITPFDHPDSPVLDVISSILGQGETSRLYQKLRNEEGLVYRVGTSAFTPKYPGLLETTAVLDSSNMSSALEAMLVEFFKLKYLPVSTDELNRVKRNVESDFVFNLERAEGQARVLGSFEFLSGDPREDDYLDTIRAVSREDIMAVANKYFSPEKITAGCLIPIETENDLGLEDLKGIIARADEKARQSVPSSLIMESYLPNIHQYTLSNGIRLLIREEPDIPTVAMRAIFPGGLRSETEATNGAFAFISELLPTGTERLSPRELAIKIADMAGSISGFNGKNTFGLKADFLSRFFEPGLNLLKDIILTPSFDAEEAEKIRPELLAQLKQQEDSLPALTFREFNKLLFQGHPYGLNTAGGEEAIMTFTPDTLRQIYAEHARPDKMVLTIVGDVKAEQTRKLVEASFGQWSAPEELEDFETSFLPPITPAEPEIFSIERDKEQVHIIIGFLGTTLTSEDRYGLEVLETILSGQSGRLFTELRDKMSLAYSLSAFTLFGIDTGSFGLYIGTSPDKKDLALEALWKELTRIQEEGVSDMELTRARNLLIGHYELGLQTHGAQAMEMGLNQTYDLGQNFGNEYIDAIEKVDTQVVLEAAQKFIQPNHYVMVTVGAPGKAPEETLEGEKNSEDRDTESATPSSAPETKQEI